MINLTPFVSPIEELTGEREERIENAKKLIEFGVPFLADALIGLGRNDLLVIAARAGGGKSELATSISLSNAAKGKRVVHLALEAERREIPRRMLFRRLANLFYSDPFHTDEKPNYHHWYMGKQEHLLNPYYERAKASLEGYSNLRIFYRGTEFGMNDLNGIFASVKNNCDLLCLDHLHYVDFSDENENRAHKDAVKQIRDMALLHSIPVVLVAHIRKGDRRNPSPVPDLDDIHGSSDIFKIATKVVLLAPARDQDVSPGTRSHRFATYMRIAKCRQDGSLTWLCGLTAFDITRNAYEDRYALGNHDSSGVWVPATDIPFWAKGAM